MSWVNSYISVEDQHYFFEKIKPNIFDLISLNLSSFNPLHGLLELIASFAYQSILTLSFASIQQVPFELEQTGKVEQKEIRSDCPTWTISLHFLQ